MKFIRETIPYLVIILFVFIFRTFIATPVVVNGSSMYKTLEGKEIMILNKLNKNYNRFDIIVINKQIEGDTLIKRIIGLPNERIKYKDGILYINDKKVKDKYAYGDTTDFLEVKLGNDEYFVMGDNRINSLDSRSLGPIHRSAIEGKTSLVLYPFNKFGYLK